MCLRNSEGEWDTDGIGALAGGGEVEGMSFKREGSL